MSACCSPFECAADQQFNEKEATGERKRYRTKGPGPTTRLLQESIFQTGTLNGTLLDIGSGIGSLTFGLLERGVTHAVAVDASSAYNGVARQEAERLGRADAVRFVHADFVSVASELPAATLVTLDRVVCCYPSYEALLNPALRHAEKCFALSYPRDVWYVRLGVLLENAQRRLTKNPFRTFVHPAARMEELIRTAGFERATRRETWMWSVDVYTQKHRLLLAATSSIRIGGWNFRDEHGNVTTLPHHSFIPLQVDALLKVANARAGFVLPNLAHEVAFMEPGPVFGHPVDNILRNLSKMTRETVSSFSDCF